MKNAYSLRKEFERAYKGKVYKKSYLLRLVDNSKIIKASFHSLVNNLSDKIYSQRCTHAID